jgi:ADP-heptose:LPS heptosyltransferase
LLKEKLLDNVIDMRGETKSLRELAYLLKGALFVLSNEGMYNHLSAAVGAKSFTVFGGFHPVEIALYSTTTPLVQKEIPSCAYCWLTSPCPYRSDKELPCFKKLLPSDVAKHLLEYIGKIP